MRISYKTYSVPRGPYKSYTNATYSKDGLDDAHIVLFRRGGRVSGDIMFDKYTFAPEADAPTKQFQITRIDYFKNNIIDEDNSLCIFREQDPSIYNILFYTKILNLHKNEYDDYYINLRHNNRSKNAINDGIEAVTNRTILPEFYQNFRSYKFNGVKDFRYNKYSFYDKSYRADVRNIIRYNNWPYSYKTCHIIDCSEYIKKQAIQDNNKAFVQYTKLAANIKQKAFGIQVYDPKYWTDSVKFKSASITVDSKVNVVIDQSVGDVSLVFQKNEFFEITLSNVENASNLPNGVTYSSNKIKGSITNSGEYNIIVVYNSGKTQVLNILIPFYRRLQ